MKATFQIRAWLFISSFLIKISMACTAFGIITDNGTVIGKNRDASYYAEQTFQLIQPIKQFDSWFNNPYNHRYKFYALMTQNDVKMGINESGLTIIEEDPLYPGHTRKYNQPLNGNAEGMVLFGALQNFTSIDEIKPYIDQIFKVAAPNFYQISDGNRILTVEVAYGNNESSPIRSYSYEILDKKNQHFVHTNLYLSPKFKNLNNLESDFSKIDGAEKRLQRIEWLIKNSKNNYYEWLMDTISNLTKPGNVSWCQNTSIFRSYLQGLNSAYINMPSHKVYGTASNIVVENNNDLNNSYIKLRIIESIEATQNKEQLIHYKELSTDLKSLFTNNKFEFVTKSFIRKAPNENGCY